MNRGFTIIELVATVLVLALIFLVSFPILSNLSENSEQKKYDEMVDSLCLAGKTYININQGNYHGLTTIGTIITINISDLIEYGIVDADLVNPQDNSSVSTDSLTFTVQSDYSLNCVYTAN